MAIRILANHAHVFPASINGEGTIDRLLKMLDACEIEQAVCFAPFPHQLTDANPNEWLASELKTRPRLMGFGTIDLAGDHNSAEIADQVKAARGLGFRGLKLHPNSQRFDLLSPQHFEACEAAEKEGMFIVYHSGVHAYRLKHYDVMHFDEIAEHFPDLKFSMEHMGGYSFFAQALAVIVNRIPYPPIPGRKCRVYGGLTTVFTPHFCRFWYMSRERLLEAIAQVGAAQLIFGLDFPYNQEANTRLGLDTLRELGLPEKDLAMILGGNLREAIGLPDPASQSDPVQQPAAKMGGR